MARGPGIWLQPRRRPTASGDSWWITAPRTGFTLVAASMLVPKTSTAIDVAMCTTDDQVRLSRLATAARRAQMYNDVKRRVAQATANDKHVGESHRQRRIARDRLTETIHGYDPHARLSHSPHGQTRRVSLSPDDGEILIPPEDDLGDAIDDGAETGEGGEM